MSLSKTIACPIIAVVDCLKASQKARIFAHPLLTERFHTNSQFKYNVCLLFAMEKVTSWIDSRTQINSEMFVLSATTTTTTACQQIRDRPMTLTALWFNWQPNMSINYSGEGDATEIRVAFQGKWRNWVWYF